MKKIISTILVAVMLFGIGVSLMSCGAPEDDGAQISVYLGEEIYDFDPTDYYVSSNAEQIMSLIFEPLFSVDSKGNLKCAAAKSYKIDEEKREIVIEIRESYWTDDVRVKAEDFVYAWRNILVEPNNANPAAALLYDIENAVEIKSGATNKLYDLGVEASGIYELTITYREGADCQQLLRNLASVATAPVREDVVANSNSYWTKRVSSIVTNGPFKIEVLEYGTGDFTLARNLGYHQKSTAVNYTDNVNPGALVSFFTPDGETMALTYDDIANKTVFFMSEAPLSERAEHKDDATVVDDLSTYTYVFNTENPLFAIKEVRQALSAALDREAIVEAISFAKPATGFLPDCVAGSVYGKDITNRLQSQKTAEQLLAGVDFSGISKSFTLTVNDDEQSVAIASLAKAAWEKLGFNVTINKVSSITTRILDSQSSEYIDIQDSAIQAIIKDASYGVRNFDVVAVDWQMYSNDAFVALSAFTSHMNGNGLLQGVNRGNVSGWWSIDYDHYIDLAYSASTEEERKAALAAAEAVLLDSCPVIPVVYNQTFAFVSDDLSKIGFDFFGNFSFTEAVQKDYKQYLKEED